MTPAAQRRIQVGAASLGYVYIGLFVVGFALAGFIPPPSPSDSPAEVATMFQDDTTMIRVGLLIATAGAALSLPLQAAVATQLRRIEGRWGVLSLIWVMGAALFTLELVYPLMFWLVTAFRPDADPELLQKLNDLSWLTFLGVVSTAIVQVLALGIAILVDDARRPVYPRWFAYASIWAALSFFPASLIVFFKDGPLAWNGVIAWWLALSAFGLWTVALTALTVRAVGSDAS